MYKIFKYSSHPTVDFAAEELKKYIRMMMPRCGEIEITTDERDGDGFVLALSADIGIDMPETDVPELDDVVVINTNERGGIIAASNPRALLIAVYEYLRKNGCEWLYPGVDGEFIPVIESLAAVNYRKMADMRVRAQCNEGAEYQGSMIETIDFTPKIGLNSYMLEFDNPKTYYNSYYNHRSNLANRSPEPITSEQVLQWKRACEAEIAKRSLIFQDMGHGWTAEPFGIDTTEGWAKDAENPIPEESRDFVALCEGSRSLYHGVALNTNFCMSNPKARGIVAKAIADYAEISPQVNYLHVWLADNRNNHCECDECRKKTVSDWYVMLLNAIDEELTARNLATRIAYIAYYDTAFPPLTEKIKNPDRFVLLLAAITRDYTETPDMSASGGELPKFVLNKNVFPSDLGDYIRYSEGWQETAFTPKFCYEYHFWIHQYYDFGGIRLAERLYEDVRAYRDAGFFGIIQDGSQRSFFPNGFPFYVYSRAMYDKEVSFEELREDYFSHAYGENWREISAYLEKISDIFDVKYLEVPHRSTAARKLISPKRAEALKKIAPLCAEMAKKIRAWRKVPQKRIFSLSMRILELHAEYCVGLAESMILTAEGKADEAFDAFNALFDSFGRHEFEIERYFDHHLAYSALKRSLHAGKNRIITEEIG
ncbi:MAG: DUF4838 domain-containing protein [Clostridia bacterium]|nr:DUF4838 domain-containing protein [Clostridia bacterium]